MRFAAVILVAIACTGVAGCSGQGFLTRSLGGTVVDMVPGTRPPARSGVYTLPEPVGGEDVRRVDQCVEAAQARADDTKAAGFDEVVQKRVYDNTYADCRKWRG